MKRILLLASVMIVFAMFAPVLARPLDMESSYDLYCARLSDQNRARSNTKVMLIEDVAPGSNESGDMLGPTGFGFVNFHQEAKYDLIVTVSLKNAVSHTNYKIFLVAGPTHDVALGYMNIGNLTTNIVGNGNDEMNVPLSTLQASPFGSGDRTDHIDILKDDETLDAGAYVAAGINYSVPVP